MVDRKPIYKAFPPVAHGPGTVSQRTQCLGELVMLGNKFLESIVAYIAAHKGRVLTQISLFWFDYLADIVANHLITADVDRYPAEVRKYSDQLRGRSMLVRRAEMFPVECVVRGYIFGSA